MDGLLVIQYCVS